MNCAEMTDWYTYQVWGSIVPGGVVFGSIGLVFAYILVNLYCNAFGHKTYACLWFLLLQAGVVIVMNSNVSSRVQSFC